MKSILFFSKSWPCFFPPTWNNNGKCYACIRPMIYIWIWFLVRYHFLMGIKKWNHIELHVFFCFQPIFILPINTNVFLFVYQENLTWKCRMSIQLYNFVMISGKPKGILIYNTQFREYFRSIVWHWIHFSVESIHKIPIQPDIGHCPHKRVFVELSDNNTVKFFSWWLMGHTKNMSMKVFNAEEKITNIILYTLTLSCSVMINVNQSNTYG